MGERGGMRIDAAYAATRVTVTAAPVLVGALQTSGGVNGGSGGGSSGGDGNTAGGGGTAENSGGGGGAGNDGGDGGEERRECEKCALVLRGRVVSGEGGLGALRMRELLGRMAVP